MYATSKPSSLGTSFLEFRDGTDGPLKDIAFHSFPPTEVCDWSSTYCQQIGGGGTPDYNSGECLSIRNRAPIRGRTQWNSERGLHELPIVMHSYVNVIQVVGIRI